MSCEVVPSLSFVGWRTNEFPFRICYLKHIETLGCLRSFVANVVVLQVHHTATNMSWSSVLRKVRPQELFSSLAARPFSVAVGARLPCSVDGRALGAAVGGSGSSPLPGRSPLGDERLSVGMGAVGQCRGMAASNHRHKKILKMAKG